jgi:hypothetical protein
LTPLFSVGYTKPAPEVNLMRGLLLVVFVSLISLGAAAQRPNRLQLSQIPNGTMSNKSYVNDALGVSYQIPDGWKGDPDPKGVPLDWRGPGKVANRCSRILLWLTPVSKVEGRFNPVAAVFATDPDCLGAAVFPQSLDQVKEINKVAKKMGDSFNYTSFMSPYGNTVHSFSSEGRVIIQADGGLVINAHTGRDAKTKEPLELKTSFRFTETSGLLIVWAYAADASAAEVLKPLQVTFNKK